MPHNHEWQVSVVVMTPACHADDPSSIPRQGNDLFLWYLYVYCTSIIWFHVSIHQYTSFHLPKYHWCSGVNTCLPSRRVGFNPQRGLTFVIFCWNCPSHGRILEKTYQNDLQIALVNLRQKKFTVGHFDLGRYVCLRNLDCVKDNDYKLYFL